MMKALELEYNEFVVIYGANERKFEVEMEFFFSHLIEPLISMKINQICFYSWLIFK